MTCHRCPSPMPSFPIATLTVQPWPDPVIDAVGHEVRSPYVERFWLGLLGPSSTWLLRRLVAGLDERARRLRARPGPHRHRARPRRPVRAALAVPPLDRPVLPVRRRPPDRRDHPAGAAQAPAAHPDPDRPASRRLCSRPTRRGPTRPRPASRSTSCGSEPAASPSPSSSSARTPRPPSASSTPGGCTPPSPTKPSPGRSQHRSVTRARSRQTTYRPRPRRASPRRATRLTCGSNQTGVLDRGALEPDDVGAGVGVEVGEERGVGARHREAAARRGAARPAEPEVVGGAAGRVPEDVVDARRRRRRPPTAGRCR